MSRKSFWFLLSPVVILALVFGGSYSVSAVKKAAYQAPASQSSAPENTLLQFTAGGHILGFKPDKVYFAVFNHAIIEEFVGTKGVMPIGEAGKGKTEDAKGAPQLGKVIYKDLWKGITLQYESRNGGIAESTYLLDPEAEVKDIRLKYNVPIAIKKDGTLRFRHSSDKGYFSLRAPKAWQEIEGKRTPVEVAYADYGDNTIGFRLGEYNRQYQVVIDPTYSWHTFYGGIPSGDIGYGIAVDTSGNLYVTGNSTATWNGPGGTAPLNAFSGGNFDIVVLKLNSAGVYQWHTFYGSAGGTDAGQGIAVDTSGNVYVTGNSNATWNGPGAAVPLNAYSGGDDIVILKLAGAFTVTVTANATGNGSGTVASNTGGISYTYQTSNTGTTSAVNYGTSVVITATGGNSTVSWSGTCTAAGGVEAGNGTTTATCTFSSINSNKTATVTFSSTVTVPTMTEWGMLIFTLLAGLSSIYYMRRGRA